jgi:hypothetical protein
MYIVFVAFTFVLYIPQEKYATCKNLTFFKIRCQHEEKSFPGNRYLGKALIMSFVYISKLDIIDFLYCLLSSVIY